MSPKLKDPDVLSRLDEFRDWLTENHGLTRGTARSYRRTMATVLSSGGPLYDALRRDNAVSYKAVVSAALRRWAEFTGDEELAAALREDRTRRLIRVPPSTPPAKTRTALSDEEFGAFIEALGARSEPTWSRPVLGLMAKLGLRSNDVLRLSRADLVTAAKDDRIRVVGKGEKARWLPTAPVRAEVEVLASVHGQWRNVWDLVARTCRLEENRPEHAYRLVWEEVRAVAELAGVEGMTTHRLRKTVARRLYEATGSDINWVRKLLGHADTKTTVRYLEIDEDDWIASTGSLLERE